MKKIIKPIVYIFALMFLGSSIALIQNTNLGMAPWDALARNFYQGIPIQYAYLSPILSLVMILVAYLILWKKPDIQMIFPVIVSTIIGLSADLALTFIPNQVNNHFLWNYFYLFSAMILISVAINVIIYSGYILPSLEQLAKAISERLSLSFGKAKLIGEACAFLLTVIFGLIFHHQDDYFFIGETTIIILVFIGFLIDFMRKPIFNILGRLI